MKKQAFTLTEVLLTLAIVGVVSALTLPTLINNYQNDIYTTSLRKVFNELSGAAERFMADEHIDNFYESDILSEDGMNEFADKYLKIATKCGTECYSNNELKSSEKYQDMSRGSKTAPQGTVCLNTPSSVVICMSEKDNHLWFDIDTNGKKGPNTLGRDAFSLQVYDNGNLINEDLDEYDPAKCKSSDWKKAEHCVGLIVKGNWKMNY